MNEERIQRASGPPERFRWMFHYSIDGDLRYISHHDTLRLFRRALARADIPVRFSEGFNPHPRITIPLPRPVGVASRAEAIVIETQGELDPDDALARLRSQAPPNLCMIRAERLLAGEKRQPDLVRYRLDFDTSRPADLTDRVAKLQHADVVPVERKDPKSGRIRALDIKPFVVDIRVDDSGIEFTLKVTGYGTAKPIEVLTALGFEAGEFQHRIWRQEVSWR